jgi:hypothetical protein
VSGFELVAGVIAIFFGLGILLGILAVIALGRGGGRGGPGSEDPPGWEEPPGPDDDTQPRWPGGTSA